MRVRAALALALVAGALTDCALFPRTEPHASRDVLDAIYDGMRKAQQTPPATG